MSVPISGMIYLSPSDPALPPIVMYDLKALKALGRTPRSPEDQELEVRYDQLDRDKTGNDCVGESLLAAWLRLAWG